MTTTIKTPTNYSAPTGYHFGAHATVRSGSGYYLIRDTDGASVVAIEDPSLDSDEAPSVEEIDEAMDAVE